MLFCSLTTDLLSALCYDQSADSTVLAVLVLFCLRQCIAQKLAAPEKNSTDSTAIAATSVSSKEFYFCISPDETAAPASAGCPLLGVEAAQGELLLLPQPDAPPIHSLEGILNKSL